MVAHFDANVFQVLQLLVVAEDRFVSVNESFLASDLFFHVFFLFFSQHSFENGVARSLVHLEYVICDYCLDGTLRQVVDE